MEKVWLKNYQRGVAAEINPNQYNSLNEMFLETCNKFSKNPSFYNLGHTITYAELEAKSRDFAAFLQNKLQLKKGDRFAIMLPNLLQYPIALFGCLRAGLIVVNINPLYTAAELKFQLQDSGAKAILVLENFAHTVAEAIECTTNTTNSSTTAITDVIVTSMGDALPFPKNYLINFVVRYCKRLVPAWHLPGHFKFNFALQLGNSLPLNPVRVTGADLALLQYTGGTTGIAKGAMLTHRNMVANMLQASDWLSQAITPGKETIITALPLYHIFSLTANCLIFTRLGALNVLITNPKDLDYFIKELAKFKFTAITGVNTLFNALLNHAKFAKLNFDNLKLALGGGMAVQRAVAERWQKVTNKPLLEAYGLTETSPAACINPVNLFAYNGSIGLPIGSTEVSIRNADDQELGFNEVGELWIRGPQVMLGYWNKPEETSKVLTEDGWLRTGDMASINADGYIKIVDRKKDMIIVSGFKVYPNEVEDVISHIPGVKEVAIIGIANNACGETVKAIIVKNDPTLTADMVIAHCHKYLTPYKVPKIVEFANDLPKTNVGKVLRRALR